MNIMQQYTCVFVNPITFYSYGFLFICRTVGQASDSLFYVPLIVCGGSVFGIWFVMHCLVSSLV